jgi:hypothetical protein
LYRRLCGLQRRYGLYKEKYVAGIELQLLLLPVLIQVAVPSELSWLQQLKKEVATEEKLRSNASGLLQIFSYQ